MKNNKIKENNSIVKKIISPSAMIKLGEIIGSLAYPNMIIAMNGDLGAGKTTLTKGIGKALNIKRVINSPTFTIMKVYDGDLTLYHLDTYRVESSKSDFDLEEYFYLGGVSVIEWANNIKELIPNDAIIMDYKIENDAHVVTIHNMNDDFFEKLKKVLESVELNA